MDQITHTVRREQWLNIINACQSRSDDVSVRQWLKDNNIGYKSYYYWLRKFRKEAFEEVNTTSSGNEVSFAEILLQNEPENKSVFESDFRADAIIKTAGCVVALSNSVSDSLCRTIMEGLKHAT